MKHVLLIFFLCLGINYSHTQSISKQVIGSSGQILTNETHSINFTVGEAIVGKIESGSTIYQGFWAAHITDETLSIQTLTQPLESISIFPNPVVNLVQIKYNLKNAENYLVHLYDVNGKQIFNVKPINQIKTTQINMSHLSQGMYLVLISDKTSNYKKSIKIIKN